MFWKTKEKIDSREYIELLNKLNILNVKIATLEIDLALYVKKLRASKGIKDKEEEPEKDINQQILPM